MVALALAMVAVAVMGGANSAVATLNGMIGRRLGPWRATYVFMSVGAVCALGFVVVWERSALDLALLRGLPPYALLPGLLNTAMVATVIRVVSQIGAMQATASIFSGSVLVGLLIDHVGAFGLSTIPGSATRVVGAVLLVTAVVLMTLAHRQRGARAFPVAVPTVAAAIVVGAVDNLAMAINASVAQQTGPFAAAFAFLLPGVVVLALVLRRRRPRRSELRPADLVPGAWNVLTLAVSMLVIPIVGVHLANGTRFAAAIIAAIALDHVGAFGSDRVPLSPLRVVSAAMLVLGVGVSLV